MSPIAPGRTWDEASRPEALRLARQHEDAWRASAGARPDPAALLPSDPGLRPAALLALLRTDLALRRRDGESITVEWYRRRYPDLGAEALVALIYEEFCLREEAGERPVPAEYEARFPEVADALREVLDIHGLVAEGSGSSTALLGPPAPTVSLPEAGQTIAGFHLVEELGRGAFARVFRAEERQLADRPVALKVSRLGSREPQTLARLQHTHIVPVHSYRIDPVTGLHLLCMPYFGRVTLAQVLAEPGVTAARSGAELLAALDRLQEADGPGMGRPAARLALGKRTYARAIAWWGARLAEALQHAHDRGVLHRDIKPTNVLVTADGLPMLLDFNLAHDPRAEAAESRLGGTLAYMAPEHLEAMIAGQAERIGRHTDLYALGMVLLEALGGQTLPPPTAVGGAPATDGLRRLLEARRAGVPRFPEDVPAELEAVLRRVLDPVPSGRHASAAELAADLQAVADDAPLRHAREPLPSRSGRWLRRNRRRLALTAPILLALVAFNVAQFRAQAVRIRREAGARHWSWQAERSSARGEFGAAAAQLATAAEMIQDRPDLQGFRNELRGRLREAIAAREIREQADALSRRAEPLRFRLLGFGGDRGAASRELAEALEPFGVLGDPSWARRPALGRLDVGRRTALLEEIDELLFIWLVALATDRPDDPEMARRALAIGAHAPDTADVRAPWQALRAWWRARPGAAPPEVPADPSRELSAGACFRWGLLATLGRDRGAARAWLERATRHRPDHYWSWFALAYHDEATGDIDRALAHYEVAVALRPGSPWARFNRARLYGWSRGAWGRALDDLDRALELASGSGSVAAEARLERARVRQAIGDVAGARADFEAVIAADPRGSYARAARLNHAKLVADAGFPGRARAAYDALLAEDPADRSARKGRALLALRGGRADAAEADVDLLLRDVPDVAERAELLSWRAMARLARGHPDVAAADAAEALRLAPGSGTVRIWARAELAAGRTPDIRLLPDDLDRWPVGGKALAADLRRAVDRLRPAAEEGEPDAGTARLVLALLLCALGDHAAAAAEADRAVDRSPDSVDARAIRARIRRRSGDAAGARADVERGLALRPDDPRLLELRGRLEIEAGGIATGLAVLDRALFFGAGPSARTARARARMALGRHEEALEDWSRVLADDPDAPDAYLGRARTFLRLRLWDQALADLEKAAERADEGSPLFGQITWTYASCLLGRPDRLPRVAALAVRHIIRNRMDE